MFLAAGDEFREVAGTMPSVSDGSHVVMIHGDASSTHIGNRNVSVSELAQLVRADPQYEEGQPVTLFSCETGATNDGFAQQLARELGVPVTAPTELTWLPPDSDGTPCVSPEDPRHGGPVRDAHGRGLGGWRRFDP